MEGLEIERLRDTYRGLLDGEILSLAADAKSLTDVARSALQEEIARRGLNAPTATPSTQALHKRAEIPSWRNWSKLASTSKKHGSSLLLLVYGLSYAWIRFRYPQQHWIPGAFRLLILVWVIVGAVFEIRRINKKQRRRTRLAHAFHLDTKR